MEAQGTLSDRRSTGASGAGRQNCEVVVAVVQTPQRLTDVAMGTVEMKTILNMMLMPPCVHSLRQLLTLHV